MPSKGKKAAVMEDERFSHIKKDPRFQRMPVLERKVKIDKRFRGMFKDKRFKEKYTVDKRGRPVNLTTSEDLKKFYELTDSEEESEGKKGKERKKKGKEKKKKKTKLEGSDDDSESKAIDQPTKSTVSKGKKVKSTDVTKRIKGQKTEDKSHRFVRKQIKEESESSEEEEEESDESESENDDTSDDGDRGGDSEVSNSDDDGSDNSDGDIDLARGEGNASTSDSEDEEFDFVDTTEVEHNWGELDADAEMTTDVSSRLAVCNMDWDRIKAADLLVLFNSFKPTGGIIKSVKIFLSEFGKERLKEEDVKGPKELVENDPSTLKQLDGKEGEKYHTERLREYQMKRLKYYYAVIECDSKETANGIYEECDGFEYQNSSTRLDLRFIPDEMAFDDEPTSQATDLPEVSAYKPSDFMTSALQQTKVDLTWDETDRDRLAITTKRFNKDEVMDLDLKDYLASSSGEEDDDENIGVIGIGSDSDNDDAANDEDRIAKYRALLTGGDDKKDDKKYDKDMELEISWEPGLKETTETLIKTKEEEKDMTPWQQYQKKKKEKKREKRKEERIKREEIKKKRDGETVDVSDDELPSDVDLNDPYFKEELEKEQDAPGTGKVKDKKKKKRKRRTDDDLTAEELAEKKQREAELELLMMDDEDDGKQHFSLKAIMDAEKDEKRKKKKKKRKQDEEETFKDTFEVDVADSRFSAIFDSHHYQIDPSDPQFKKTKAMDKIFKEKQKRREQREILDKKRRKGEIKSQEHTVAKDNQPRKDPSLSMLVKSVKQKTGQFHSKKQKKMKP